MQVRMVGSTNVGMVRKKNQDNFYFNSRQGIVIVADGIGGRKAGEVASGIAVKKIRDSFLACENLRHEEVGPFLASNIEKVNRQIIEKGKMDEAVAGMGTTVNCLLFVGSKVSIGHVGDSRTYLFYRGHLWQLTIDHSIEMYVDRGWLPEDALLENSSKPGALVRALGLSTQCEIDIYEKEVRANEIYITCSDGLTGMVSNRKITKIIRENIHQLDKLPRILIAEANRNGGKDNITVVISEVNR